MISRTSLSLALATLVLATSAAPAQQNVPTGAKVLLLSGGQRNHHGYRRQAQLLQKALEDSKQFQVTLCEDAALLELVRRDDHVLDPFRGPRSPPDLDRGVAVQRLAGEGIYFERHRGREEHRLPL